MEFMFCAMLVARSPAGAYNFLKGFYWNARWQSAFRTVGGVVTAMPVARGNGCGVGQVLDGKPSDRRFRTMLEHPQHRNCNDVAAYASSHPNIRETMAWQDFDVTH